MKLRPYQAEAVQATYDYLRKRDDNPCVVIPTAGGKTPVMATICRDAVQRWGGRVMILAHVKELLEQAVDKLHVMAPDLWMQVGIYSAGLRKRDTEHAIIVAGIQSVFRRACDLGPFDLILVDEAHMIPPDGDGMYQTFLSEAKVVNPHVRLVGLTATPYRMSSGMICGQGNLLNEICYEVGVKELIVQGYLSPLRSKAGKRKIDTSGLHVRAGEFIAGEVERLMDSDNLVNAACAEILELTADRQSVLIFAAGVKHALHVQEILAQKGHECGFVCGETLPFERADVLARFKDRKLKYLVNVNVLTTGFDATGIDCVVLLRPTLSPGLYYQMVGRGFRLHPGKTDCLVLDFGGNILRHGPVDDLRIKDKNPGSAGEAPAKECPQCNAVVHAARATCPECGYEFPPPERQRHDQHASEAGVLSGEIVDMTYEVTRVAFSVHHKKNAGPEHPPTMRVDYYSGMITRNSEWVCFQHDGYARVKAERWWKARSKEPVPATVEQAVAICESGAIAATKSIVVRSVSGEKFDRIIGYDLGPIPEPEVFTQDAEDDAEGLEMAAAAGWIDDDDIPF